MLWPYLSTLRPQRRFCLPAKTDSDSETITSLSILRSNLRHRRHWFLREYSIPPVAWLLIDTNHQQCGDLTCIPGRTVDAPSTCGTPPPTCLTAAALCDPTSDTCVSLFASSIGRCLTREYSVRALLVHSIPRVTTIVCRSLGESCSERKSCVTWPISP